MATLPKRILVVGGTGVFGKRLVRHLIHFPNIELFVSSRSEAKAKACVRSIKHENPKAKIRGIGLDREQNFSNALAELQPFIVIDCSGPFQTESYEVARATLQSGAHHIDLADARNYLTNYAAQLGALAVKNKTSGSTGASSTPTLSACVVKALTKDWQQVDTIDICITPGGKSEVGQSVIKAIMSYTGEDIPTWREGKLCKITGWTGSRIVEVPNLGSRRVAPVETMDAELLGPLYKIRSRLSFAAGLESSLEQWGLQTIACLRKHRLVPHPKHLIPLLLRLRKFTRIFNSDQGGMLVEVRGINGGGTPVHSKWSVLAKQDHGPFIPILPAAAIARKLLNSSLVSGAFIACEQIVLDDILREMEPYDISTETQVEPQGVPV